MGWYLRVVETTEQQWKCRWGTHTYDEHATRGAAEAHIRALAAEHQPATIYVTGSTGRSRPWATCQTQPALRGHVAA
jgi:hypothetical protein